jgi:hypothetical protein
MVAGLMTRAPLVDGWIAHIVFWLLLALGFFTSSLSVRGTRVFVVWLLAYAGLPAMDGYRALLTTPGLAILDVVLVLLLLPGDVRLT